MDNKINWVYTSSGHYPDIAKQVLVYSEVDKFYLVGYFNGENFVESDCVPGDEEIIPKDEAYAWCYINKP